MITQLLKLELEQYILDNYEPIIDEELSYCVNEIPHPGVNKPLPRMAKPHPSGHFEAPSFKETELTFQEALLKYIDDKGLTDVEVYKSAEIDRRHFSKIRSNKHYAPRKDTVIKFCLSLSLSIEESKDLLEKAGYALSKSLMRDIIIEFCIRKHIYTLMEVNEFLYDNNQPIL